MSKKVFRISLIQIVAKLFPFTVYHCYLEWLRWKIDVSCVIYKTYLLPVDVQSKEGVILREESGRKGIQLMRARTVISLQSYEKSRFYI